VRRLRGALAIAALLALAGCASPATEALPAAPAAAAPAAVAKVVRDGDQWTVEYRFARASPVWAFNRSALPHESDRSWRTQSWTVETPGVQLERRGRYDVLTAADGAVPSVVRVRFTPFTGIVTNSYDPALAFSDGSVALFDGQFKVFPVASGTAADALPHDTRDIPEAMTRTRIEFRDAGGRVLYRGRRHDRVSLEGIDTYVLFGPAEPIVSEHMAAIIDPALPLWLRSFLAKFVPAVIARHAAVLGPPPGAKPTVMVTWSGPTPRRIGMSGSNLRDLITMNFEGEGVVRERPALRNQARWFVAHEAAHFWLGQAVRYAHSREAWITEGGADLLAIRAVQGIDPSYDWKAQLNASIADCAELSKGRGIAAAAERREHRAHYACGALFGLLVEHRSGRPFAEFVRGLVEANRTDRILSPRSGLRPRGSEAATRS